MRALDIDAHLRAPALRYDAHKPFRWEADTRADRAIASGRRSPGASRIFKRRVNAFRR